MGFLSNNFTRKEFVDGLFENNWNRPGDKAFFGKLYDYLDNIGMDDDPLGAESMWAPSTLFAYEGDKQKDREAVAGFIREMMNNPAYKVPEALKESFQNNFIAGNPGVEEPEEKDEYDAPEEEKDVLEEEKENDAPEEENVAPKPDDVDIFLESLADEHSPSGKLLKYTDEMIARQKENFAEEQKRIDDGYKRREAARDEHVLHDQVEDLREAYENVNISREERIDFRKGYKSKFVADTSLKEFVTKAKENGWTSREDLAVFVSLYKCAEIVDYTGLNNLLNQITTKDDGLNEFSRMIFIEDQIKPAFRGLWGNGLISHDLTKRLEENLTYISQDEIDNEYRYEFDKERPQSSYEKRMIDAQTAGKKNPDDKIISELSKKDFLTRIEDNGWIGNEDIMFENLYDYKSKGLWKGDPVVDSFLTELANTSVWGPYNRDRLMKQIPEVISVLEGKNTNDRQVIGKEYLDDLRERYKQMNQEYQYGWNIEEDIEKAYISKFGSPYQKTEDDIRFESEQREAEEKRLAEEKRAAEQRKAEIEQRLAEERRVAEERKVAEERRATEERKVAEEQRAAEERKAEEEQRAAEERKVAEEQRAAEERKVAEEQRAAEERKVVEEQRAAEERKVVEEQERQRNQAEAQAEEERLYGYMTNDQKDYIQKRKRQIEAANDGFKMYIDVYGPNGKAPQLGNADKTEYDNTVIDIDEMLSEVQFANEAEKKAYTEKIKKELDPTVVTAIVLGTCMEDDRLSEQLTNSTSQGDLRQSNQGRLIDDVMKKEDRAKKYIPILTDGRKKAKEAIRNYVVNKNVEGIKSSLSTLADFTINEAITLTAGQVRNDNNWEDAQKTGIMLCHEIVEKKPFGVIANPKNEIGIITAESHKKQMRAMMESDIIKTSLVDNFDQLTKEQKEVMVGDMLFNAYISQMARVQAQYEPSKLCRVTQTNKLVDAILEKHGIDGTIVVDEENDYTIKSVDPVKDIVEMNLPGFLSKTRVSDFDVILAGKNGEQQLKSLYMDSIKESEIFKNIVASGSKNELIDQIMSADKVVVKGITSIEDVKLPNVNKDILKKYQREYDGGMKKFEEEIVKAALSYDVLTADTAKKYGFTSLKPDAVKKNAENIKALYKMIDGNNTWGGSDNYKNLLDKLKSLKELSEKQAKHGLVLSGGEAKEYKELVQEVDELADVYLENKKDIDSPYARKRVEGVRELRLALKANLLPLNKAVETMKKEKAEELFGDIRKVINATEIFGNPAAESTFYGEKYKDRNTRVHGPYSLERSAGISVSIFALAATGKYTLDELMDPTKFKEEKAAMYDKVATCMKNARDPKNQEWIAKQIYEGQKAVEHMVDVEAAGVDFSDPNIMNNKTFCQLLHLTFHQFDAWQEMKHCSNEILALAKKDHPEMNTYKDYRTWWTGRETPLQYLRTAINKQEEIAIKMATEKDEIASNNAAGELIMDAASIKKTFEELNKVQKAGTDKPFREWLNAGEMLAIGILDSGTAKEKYDAKLKYLKNDPKLTRDLTKSVLDGKFTKNLNATVDPGTLNVTLNGLPTKEQAEYIAKNYEFLKKSDAAINRLKTGQYRKGEQFVKDSAYAIIGQMYRLSGASDPFDSKTGQKLTLDEYMKKMLKNDTFINDLKSENDPKKWRSPKSVADMVTNNEKMNQYINNYKKTIVKADKKIVDIAGPRISNNHKAPVAPKGPVKQEKNLKHSGPGLNI